MPHAINISGLRKDFGTHRVLDGVDLHVEPGEFVSLLGPSGCGKSTLLRIVAGLETQDAGTVSIGGRAVDTLRPGERKVAMVFQNYALYPHLSVRDNIAMPLLMSRLSFLERQPLVGHLVPGRRSRLARIDAEVVELARTLGLSELLQRKPGQLSGGQRQRAALARAMVRQPAAFLMDEPLSNLDATLRLQVRDELADLHRRLGATFVFVTHDQTEAMSLSNRVAVMQHGRILQFATPQALYEQPDCLDVARFVGSPSINVVPLRAQGGLRQLAGTESIALAGPGAPALMTQGGAAAIRPEHLLLAPGREAFTGPADAQVPAILRHAEHHGADWILQVQVAHWPEPVSVRVPLRQWPQPIKPGDAVRLGWRWSDWLLFDASGSRCEAQAISLPDSTMSAASPTSSSVITRAAA